ncbi:MAG: hypothetical protein ACLTLY_08455 [Agathobacter rectalis]
MTKNKQKRRIEARYGLSAAIDRQIPNPPGSGKDIAESKGVHREMESEGSWM